MPRLVPGDPIKLIAGDAAPQLGKERIAALRAQYGLDKPLSEQYVIYLKQLAHGDLGMSYRYSGGKTVVEVLSENFRWTLLLVGESSYCLIHRFRCWEFGLRQDTGIQLIWLAQRNLYLAVHPTVLAGNVIDSQSSPFNFTIYLRHIPIPSHAWKAGKMLKMLPVMH